MAEVLPVGKVWTGSQYEELGFPGFATNWLSARRLNIENTVGKLFDSIASNSLQTARTFCAQDEECGLTQYPQPDDNGYNSSAIFYCPRGTEQCARFAMMAAIQTEELVEIAHQNIAESIVEEQERLGDIV